MLVSVFWVREGYYRKLFPVPNSSLLFELKCIWPLNILHKLLLSHDDIIAQFRYIKIRPKTIDLSTRLRGINYRVLGVYSQEPRSDVYCVRLNIKYRNWAIKYHTIIQFWPFLCHTTLRCVTKTYSHELKYNTSSTVKGVEGGGMSLKGVAYYFTGAPSVAWQPQVVVFFFFLESIILPWLF